MCSEFPRGGEDERARGVPGKPAGGGQQTHQENKGMLCEADQQQ